MSKADRELSGNFAANRGKLPMPISGAYIITSHYGQYAVEGLRNVKLDNKGIDIQGKPGAQARAIFDGKVAAVFQLNGLFNVLIRHGNYISVYCNLSSASVKSGDMVKTKQSIGQVFSDGTDNGRTVLHFQLRREKAFPIEKRKGKVESGTLAEPIVKQCKAYVYKKYVKTKSFLGKLLQMKGVFGIFFLMYYPKS